MLGAPRLNSEAQIHFDFKGKEWRRGVRLGLSEEGVPKSFKIDNEVTNYLISQFQLDSDQISIELEGSWLSGLILSENNSRYLSTAKGRWTYAVIDLSDQVHLRDSHAGELRAPMPGKVVMLKVKEGQNVKKGDVLLVMEAMKMEHSIIAPQDGVIQSCLCKVGDQVAESADLIVFE